MSHPWSQMPGDEVGVGVSESRMWGIGRGSWRRGCGACGRRRRWQHCIKASFLSLPTSDICLLSDNKPLIWHPSFGQIKYDKYFPNPQLGRRVMSNDVVSSRFLPFHLKINGRTSLVLSHRKWLLWTDTRTNIKDSDFWLRVRNECGLSMQYIEQM